MPKTSGAGGRRVPGAMAYVSQPDDLQRGKQGAANTGVVDVAHQADLQALEAALVLPDGVKVSSRAWVGVIVLAVASADNACGCILAHDVRKRPRACRARRCNRSCMR